MKLWEWKLLKYELVSQSKNPFNGFFYYTRINSKSVVVAAIGTIQGVAIYNSLQ